MNKLSVLTSLFTEHHSDLRRLIAYKFKKSHADAEDVVQDAFHNILRHENIQDIENPKAYLFQTANNLALNRIRSRQRYETCLDNAHTDDEYALGPERSVVAEYDLNHLAGSLSTFPDKYRKTFLLNRVDGKSYREISEELGISQSTVEKHIIKTLKYLRDQMAKEELK